MLNNTTFKLNHFDNTTKAVIMARTNQVLRAVGYSDKSLHVYTCGRLKRAYGMFKWVSKIGVDIEFSTGDYKISLGKYAFEKYGSDQMLSTLDHELAHFVEVVRYGHSDHGWRFREILKTIEKIK